MNTDQTNSPLLDEASAAMMRRGVSVCVAGRDADNVPCLARALGCRISGDRRWLTVFLSPLIAAQVLENLRDNGAIAVAVNLPSTCQALQLKGTVARMEPVSETDLAFIANCRDVFAQEIGTMGYQDAFARVVVPEADADCVAVTFSPAAAFEQTPGRNAGKPLVSVS